jgi:glutathione S-transferase
MLVVRHPENSRSRRVLWLLEEPGVPCEVRRYRRAMEQGGPFAIGG